MDLLPPYNPVPTAAYPKSLDFACFLRFIATENMVFFQVIMTETNAGGVPKGAKTSDYYRVNNIPGRFDNPGNEFVL